MKNRRGFLTALSAVSGAGLGLTMAAAAGAQTPSPPAAPPASPPIHKAPSAAALAVAATFRAFDPALSDAELHVIARNIDEYRAGAAALNPKSKPLRNSDEPVARFAADEAN